MTTTAAALEDQSTDLVAVDRSFDPLTAIASIGGEKSLKVVSTFAGDDETGEIALAIFAAVSDAEQLADHIGEVIALENAVFQAITIHEEATLKSPEKFTDLVRTILLDADGTAYATTSETIFKSLETMFAILGKPHTWNAPKNVSVIEKQAKLGKFFSLVPVMGKKASK